MPRNVNYFDPAIQSPCKDCQNRRVGCHDTCYLYKEFRKKKDRQITEERDRAWKGNLSWISEWKGGKRRK